MSEHVCSVCGYIGHSANDPDRPEWCRQIGEHVCDQLAGYWERRAREAERDRDLAIAHDTQPYPTADAYERLAAAHAKCRVLTPEATAPDHAPGCDVFRIDADEFGEPRHCDCGFALWDAKRRGVYNWTPPATPEATAPGLLHTWAGHIDCDPDECTVAHWARGLDAKRLGQEGSGSDG